MVEYQQRCSLVGLPSWALVSKLLSHQLSSLPKKLSANFCIRSADGLGGDCKYIRFGLPQTHLRLPQQGAAAIIGFLTPCVCAFLSRRRHCWLWLDTSFSIMIGVFTLP